MPIWPHNEYGWSTINPAWLTFSALVIPESGEYVIMLDLTTRAKSSRWGDTHNLQYWLGCSYRKASSRLLRRSSRKGCEIRLPLWVSILGVIYSNWS